MYSILNIIYGAPLTAEISRKISEWESEGDKRWTDEPNGQCGFETLYHGSADRLIGFVGVRLGELDETEDFSLSRLSKFKPTKEQKREARRRIDALDPELRTLLPEIDTWVVFSTS